MRLLTTEESNIFLTADTHFSDEYTRKRSRRPFADINAMDLAMIDRWNNKVKPNDKVIHIGDFGNYDMVSKLNGNITLLAGNHERDDVEAGKINEQYLLSLGFKDVYLEEKRIFITLDGDPFELVHEPSYSTTNNYTLFGHIHKLQMVKRGGLNVGVDCHNYEPLSLKEVFAFKKEFSRAHTNFNKEVFYQF